jgi:serine/threonine-protein kinase
MGTSIPSLSEPFAGRYTVERELGRGATATVWLAHDTVRSQAVAIKLLRPELADSTAADRFLKEIRYTSTLEHPQILPVLDAGESAGQLYFVLPFMDGGTLRDRLKRESQLPVAEAIAIARTVAEALDAAHQRGLIHRDVKPENILFSEGRAFIADFGIARALEKSGSDTSTSAGTVRGTIAYMSPEQASGGRNYDGRTDVFSLGCVLYEMIAGMPAFMGATPELVLAQRFTHEPRPISVYRPSAPAELEPILRKAMALSPADRYRTAGEFAAALESLQHELDRSAATRPLDRDGRSESSSRPSVWRTRRPALAVAALAVIGLGAWAVRSMTSSPALGKRDWILVADFQGPANEKSLAPTVRDLVTAALDQSRDLGTVTRQQLNSVMRLAGVPETTHVDAELARQLAVRTSVRAIIAGSIQRIAEDRYSVALHVVSADDDRNLFSLATTATERDLVKEIGNLSRDLRHRLGEARSAIDATLPLEEVATPSFRAYQKYADAMGRASAGDVKGSNALLRDAIAIDSSFASAWAALGTNDIGTRSIDSAQAAFEKALSIPGRLTTAQKYRLQADIAYSIEHDVPAAIRWYDLYIAEQPRSRGGRNNRALYLSAIGRYDDAAADLDTVVRSNPFGPATVQVNMFNLVAMLVSAGRVDEAERWLRDLRPPFANGARLLVSVARDRWDDVVSASAAIDSQKTSPTFVRLLARTGFASARAREGAFAEARRTLIAARDSSSAAPSVARWYERCALLFLSATGQEIPADDGARLDSSTASIMVRALAAAMRRDTATAARLLARIESAPPRERASLGLGPSLVRSWIAAAGGNWKQITDSLARGALAGEHDATVLDRVSSVEIRWLVANAYAAQGRLDSASIYMESATSSVRVPAGHLVLRGLVLPAAHGKLAEWAARAGNQSLANERWRKLTETMTKPDSEGLAFLTRTHSALLLVPAARVH